MTYQDFFNKLTNIESIAYYIADGKINPTLDSMHDHIQKALLIWSEYTGDNTNTNDKRQLEV